jgi:phosphoribosylglycinamide formyltransferase-1
MKRKYRIAIFASGSGTNAENLIRFFKKNDLAEVVLVISNKPDAFVLERAKKELVASVVMDKEYRKSQQRVLKLLSDFDVNFIVLAGYLLLVPDWLTQKFTNRIVNIHPSLLPKYGGKGMYGDFVHQAVIDNKENKSGITIHFINEHYDQGDVIFQKECPVLPDDTAETLARRIHEMEYKYFPEVIVKVLEQLSK